MARYFNTSGPNDPTRHYTLRRPTLLARGRRLVAECRYFTIFAPRQSGKSTYFLMLLDELRSAGYLPLWLTFEAFDVAGAVEFARRLDAGLREALRAEGVAFDGRVADLGDFFVLLKEELAVRCGRDKLVLVIDEIEGLLREDLLHGFLHELRAAYHRRDVHALKSAILCGVANITGILESSSSPFNVSEQLELPYFTRDEVAELLAQHTVETGQEFAPEVVFQIHHFTQGQPGLVNGFAQRLVEVESKEGGRVELEQFYRALDWYSRSAIDKNLKNIIVKAMSKKELVRRILLSDDGVAYTSDDPDLEYLRVQGIIDEDPDGMARIRLPLYKTRLLARLQVDVNGAGFELFPSEQRVARYLEPDGGLNMERLLTDYAAYVAESGFRAFDLKEDVGEAAAQVSLEGFLSFPVRHFFGGFTLLEAPAGRGKVDIMVLSRGRRYLIETKLFRSPNQIAVGKLQAAEYAHALGLSRIWYVVFTDRLTALERRRYPRDEVVEGVTLSVHLVACAPSVPSRRRKRPQRPEGARR